MASITVELPEAVAKKVQMLKPWMPTILELNLLRLQTQAWETANEITKFLLSNPSPNEVANFYVSQAAQERLEYLADANREGAMTAAERTEAEERLRIDHIGTTLKIKATKMIQQNIE